MSSPSSDSHERRVGSTLRGKYRIERLVGVGGMAAVYAGTHRNGLAVAIKILHPWAAADDGIVKRFVREGYIANAIDHPGAVRVLDDDVTEDGAVFLVMELLQGRSLSSIAGDHGGTMPVDAVLDATDQLLDVLAAAHEKQIVHRDLKPDNLFVTLDGRLKVLDLGIARMRGVSGQSNATRSGSLMGTPGFMPPEQVLGEQEKIDARSDLWAVGATMVALLSGRLVHEAPTPEQTMLRAAMSPVDPVAVLAPNVPAQIAAVIDRALVMQREDRHPDARAMQAALRAARSQTFTSGAPLLRELHAPALSPTIPQDKPPTTTSRMAGAVAIPSPPARRSGFVAKLAIAATLIGGGAFVAQGRLAARRHQATPPAEVHVTAATAPAASSPPAPIPAPAVVETTMPPVAVAEPSAKKSPHAPAKKAAVAARADASQASAPADLPPAPAGDPFDRP